MPGIWPPPNRIRFRRVSVSVTASIKRRSCVELTLTSAQSNGAVFSLCISVGHSRVRICSLLLAFGLAFVLLSAIPEENLLLRPVAAARAKPKKSRFGNCHPGAPLSVLIVRLNALFLGAKSIICSACSKKLTQVGHPPFGCPRETCFSPPHIVCIGNPKPNALWSKVPKTQFSRGIWDGRRQRENAAARRTPTAVFNSAGTGGRSCVCRAFCPGE